MSMTANANGCGVKNAGPQWQTIPTRLLLISLVSLSLMGCASQPPSKAGLCDPTPPKLQWIRTADGRVTTANGEAKTEDGGAYLSPRSLGELVNFIHDLRECATAQPSAGAGLPGTLSESNLTTGGRLAGFG